MKRHHKIILGSFSTLVILSIVVIAILLNGVIVKQNLENIKLNKQINKLENNTNEKINELVTQILNTKITLNSKLTNLNDNLITTNNQISKLKVEAGGDFSGIIKKSLISIVIIRTLDSQGSGFFINKAGYIVTNKHVLSNKDGKISKVIQILTHDQRIHSGKLIGYIKELDLAVIKINENYPSLKLENSKNVGIGEKVLAIGTPEGLSFSATDGIVSAINRKGFGTLGTYIQTNAQLNPGNSGGPLLNKQGKVIGMNNFKLVNTEGIGFALESDKIKLGVNEISQQTLNQTLID